MFVIISMTASSLRATAEHLMMTVDLIICLLDLIIFLMFENPLRMSLDNRSRQEASAIWGWWKGYIEREKRVLSTVGKSLSKLSVEKSAAKQFR